MSRLKVFRQQIASRDRTELDWNFWGKAVSGLHRDEPGRGLILQASGEWRRQTITML